jgi:iron complex transport system ATP-binding protein
VVDGRPVGRWRPGELAVRRSVLPQHAAVAFPFTVAQVVAMGRAPWARTSSATEDERAVADAMSVTEVTEFAGRTFGTLSGGERARVALARVLAQRTPVLLLDEPTAALDLRHQDLVLSVAAARAADGCGVLAVLHDLNLAAAYADRVAVVAGGRLRACGPPGEVLTSELLSEVYHRAVEVMTHPRSGTPLVLPVR